MESLYSVMLALPFVISASQRLVLLPRLIQQRKVPLGCPNGGARRRPCCDPLGCRKETRRLVHDEPSLLTQPKLGESSGDSF